MNRITLLKKTPPFKALTAHLPLLFATTLVALSACNSTPPKQKTAQDTSSHVLTKEERDKLTPEIILQQLKEGNERFRTNNSTLRNHSLQIRQSVVGQYPKAVVLSCLDSRIPVEDVFDQGLGDVFVARVAGNFVNEDILGSMEFACKIAGAKLILVMGHQHCGAVKGAIDDVKLGNLTALLSKIKPAVEMNRNFAGSQSSQNEEFVKCVAQSNIKNTLKNIRNRSAILREMEQKGQIKIVGAFYTLTKGELIFLNE